MTAIGTYAAWRRLARNHPVGGSRPDGTVRVEVSGNCSAPVHAERRYWNIDATQHRHAVFTLPCRKCAACLKRRSRFWAARVSTECRQAERTWFVTLTVSPEQRARLAMVSHHYQRGRGVKWADLSGDGAFRALHRTLSGEVTRYMKRVRERAEGPLRFCLVAEQHKDGYPHFHAVIHEPNGSLVRYREVVEPWHLGFAHAKLVPADEAGAVGAYVAKYLTKSPLGRVRASRGYGHPTVLPQHSSASKPRGVVDPRRGERPLPTPRQGVTQRGEPQPGVTAHELSNGLQVGLSKTIAIASANADTEPCSVEAGTHAPASTDAGPT